MRLSVSHISKAYHGNMVLEDCSWSFDREGVHVLMGPNGSGKSTLLRICSLLEKPDRGGIAFFSGQERLEDDMALKRRMTLVLPQVGIFNSSVFDNAAFGLRIRGMARREVERRCSEMLSLARLADKRFQRAVTLSSGEKQRLGIARALVIEPEMLFLDEPTASIDEANTRIIEEIILEKRHGMSIIMTTHDRAQAERLADQLLALRNGRIAGED
ncbi:MAG: ATP-binding cassette domain-containing protein [Nitrospiraceae bacterium]|nr:ATP-binding cassette domain-containing protein [Nitrospiraceae bacterium]